MRATWITIDGRRVKLYRVSADGMQSVNICDSANRAGSYEEVVYFGLGRHLNVGHGRFASLTAFRKFIRKRSYDQARDLE